MRFEKTADELAILAEGTATSRPVADKVLDKTALGRDFKTEQLTGETAELANLAVTTGNVAFGGSEIQIVSTDTGEPAGYFYSNGTAWFDLINSTIQNRHLGGGSVNNDKIADVSGSKIWNGSLANGKIADLDGSKLWSSSVSRTRIDGNMFNQSRGTSSARTLGGNGSSTSGSSLDHFHLSRNFNSVYTLEEMEHSANLKTTVQGMRNELRFSAIAPLMDLVLDLASQLMDEPDHDVVEKVRRLKEEAGYRHEFLMDHDHDYYAAWAREHVPEYAAVTNHDPEIREREVRGLEKHTLESDPAIVEETKRKRGRF